MAAISTKADALPFRFRVSYHFYRISCVAIFLGTARWAGLSPIQE